MPHARRDDDPEHEIVGLVRFPGLYHGLTLLFALLRGIADYPVTPEGFAWNAGSQFAKPVFEMEAHFNSAPLAIVRALRIGRAHVANAHS
jgi:hypothetical protein